MRNIFKKITLLLYTILISLFIFISLTYAKNMDDYIKEFNTASNNLNDKNYKIAKELFLSMAKEGSVIAKIRLIDIEVLFESKEAEISILKYKDIIEGIENNSLNLSDNDKKVFSKVEILAMCAQHLAYQNLKHKKELYPYKKIRKLLEMNIASNNAYQFSDLARLYILGYGGKIKSETGKKYMRMAYIITNNIQRALRDKNKYSGKIDGIAGPITVKAIREFQTKNNFMAFGEPTLKSLELMVDENKYLNIKNVLQSLKNDIKNSNTSSTVNLTLNKDENISQDIKDADKIVELDYWRYVRDKNDISYLKLYLKRYPLGQYAELAKADIEELNAKYNINYNINDYGKYYALIIGNNDYYHLPDLQTAVNDTEVLSTLLEKQYNFNVVNLINANREDILREFNILRNKAGKEDNILIYYAGHGELDKETNISYWLPIDAAPKDTTFWIRTSTIAEELRGFKSKHILIVADSCFSGKILERALAVIEETDAKNDNWLKRNKTLKGRTALTSGNNEPVQDGSIGEQHSIFAKYFIKSLISNTKIISAKDIYENIKENIISNSKQTPLYERIPMAGSEGGHFVFIKKTQ
ncbi:MAG: hypothetical protein CMJ11_06265 [Pelagibacterales bacterium]|nr:hypothetical protein [Pelagibacterales bacterium]|tara:strand:- start:11525 stop:13282 length:1758 start_codon:yes stop_codon:yes gene_type:complete